MVLHRDIIARLEARNSASSTQGQIQARAETLWKTECFSITEYATALGARMTQAELLAGWLAAGVSRSTCSIMWAVFSAEAQSLGIPPQGERSEAWQAWKAARMEEMKKEAGVAK